MLMFSVPKQSLHERLMEHDHLAGGNNMCWTTPQGWMLIIITKSSSLSSPAFLLNPLTGDKLPLPDVGDEHDIPQQCKCLLSHKDPKHPSCVIVLFHRTEPDMWCCRVVAGAAYGGWRRYTYNIAATTSCRRSTTILQPHGSSSASPRVKGRSTSPTQKKPWASSISPLTTIDPDFSYFDVAMVDYPEGMNSGINWLIESQEDLFLVCVCFVGFDATNIGAVRAYKMDFSAEE
ncbi:hypothetical protein EJB05_30117, partial [Eragrostis curvula]